MIYLLDTNMLIYMVRGLKSTKNPKNQQRAQALLEHCRKTQAAGDSVGLSAVTVSELEFGARASGQYETETHTLALAATLVSNNLAHFSRVKGLAAVNWL